MDTNECNTVIAAARGTAGQSAEETLKQMDEAATAFRRAAQEHFPREGEW